MTDQAAAFPFPKFLQADGLYMGIGVQLRHIGIVGTEDEKVDDVIRIIGEHSQKRTEIVPSTVMYGIGISSSIPLEVTVGGATIFVLPIERFEKV